GRRGETESGTSWGAEAGGPPPQSPSISRSALTVDPACSANIASTARCFAPPRPTAPSAETASIGPSRLTYMSVPGPILALPAGPRQCTGPALDPRALGAQQLPPDRQPAREQLGPALSVTPP